MSLLSWRKPKVTNTTPSNFIGRYFNKNVLYTWTPYIPLTYGPINYLEIGVADGGNAIHVANTYCKHPDSKLYCVDPWEDYDEYPEYKGHQDIGWNTFQTNIRNSGSFEKFIVNRGLSDYVVPTFADNFFDIIYVDGNHQEDYVYRDGVMALNKCKPGGYIVFDDYVPGQWDQTIRGIDRFQRDYRDHIEIVIKKTTAFQSIVRKK
jgi:predicted O-methyltransferase YrrM